MYIRIIYKTAQRSTPVQHINPMEFSQWLAAEYQSVSIDSGRYINEPNQTRILAACGGASDSSRSVIDSCSSAATIAHSLYA